MLFPQATYIQRREALRQLVGNGLIILPGNNESPMNYPANTYKFRQDSTFLYFFGQHRDGLVGVIDADTGREVLLGDEIDIDDIVWYGEVTSVEQMARECGVAHVAPAAAISEMVADARKAGRRVHFLLGCFLFFMETISQWAAGSGFENVGTYMIVGLVGLNFVFELVVDIVLSPIVVRLISIGKKGKAA